MSISVNILREESEAVEVLHTRFIGYCNILGYLTQYGSIDTNLFDKKWEEAVQINKELEQLKSQLDIKYHPNDNHQYSTYTFDFINHQIIYVE